MMNLFQLQEQLKDFSKDQLVKEMQSPSGSAPPFLVMTELQRRTRMENAAALDKGPPTSTVAQDAVNAAGMPQGGLADMARSMAPKSDVTQNGAAMGAPAAQTMGAPAAQAEPQRMAEGGAVRSDRERESLLATDPATIALANRMGMTVKEYIESMSPEAIIGNRSRIQDPTPTPLSFVNPELWNAVNPSYSEAGGADRFLAEDEISASRRPAAEAPAPMSASELGSPRVLADLLSAGAGTYRPRLAQNTSAGVDPYAAMLSGRDAGGYQQTNMGATELNNPAVLAALLGAKPEAAMLSGRDAGGYQPTNMGATELNNPAVLAALLGANPEAAPNARATGDQFYAAKAAEGVPTAEDIRMQERQTRSYGGEAAPTAAPLVDAGMLDVTDDARAARGFGRSAYLSGLASPGGSIAAPATSPATGEDPYADYYAGQMPGAGEALPFQGAADALAALFSEKSSPGLYNPSIEDLTSWMSPGAPQGSVPTEDLSSMAPQDLLPPGAQAPAPAGDVPSGKAQATAPGGGGSQGAPSGGGTGGVSVGGMPVPPPQTDEDRMMQQDKWLALARFGAALASSQAPTFGQALGQATQVGLDALGQARKDFLERKSAADEMALKRGALALKGAGRGGGGAGSGGGGSFGLSASQARGLGPLNEDISRTEQALMEAEAEVADATGTLWGNPSKEQVQRANYLRQRLADLQAQRTTITEIGAGMPITGGVAPTETMDYDVRGLVH